MQTQTNQTLIALESVFSTVDVPAMRSAERRKYFSMLAATLLELLNDDATISTNVGRGKRWGDNDMKCTLAYASLHAVLTEHMTTEELVIHIGHVQAILDDLRARLHTRQPENA